MRTRPQVSEVCVAGPRASDELATLNRNRGPEYPPAHGLPKCASVSQIHTSPRVLLNSRNATSINTVIIDFAVNI